MLTIGLTGGIGCGKSTVTDLFKQKHVPVVDADEIAHAVVQPQQPTLSILIKTFGKHIIAADGSLDRRFLRELVFNDRTEKKKLEDILHPIIYKTMHEQLKKLDSPYGILSIPLLLETRHQDKVDRVLVIDCHEATQIKRVKARDCLNDKMIDSIMKTQCTRSFRLQHADDVLNNNTTLEALAERVQKLHDFYLQMSTGNNGSYPAK
ncbi:MAG: dephospho-CoA kinase [Cycloclasticus sp.]